MNLGPIPKAFSNLQFINVYRPPSVLEENKDKFARIPIIVGHHTLVTPENAQSLMVGLIGDTIESEVEEDGELYLYATGTVVTEKGLETYEKYRQLSVGYDPTCVWQEGEHNGVKYHAVLTGFNDVNHILICQFARGGPQCTVMDSLDQYLIGGKNMSFFNKTVKKSSPELVPTLLRSIAFGADMKTQTEQIKAICGDSVFLKGLNELKDIPQNELLSATETLSMYYRKNILGDEEKEKEEAKDEKEDEEKEAKDEKEDEEKEAKDEKEEDKEDKKEAKDSCAKLSGDDMDVIVNRVVDAVMAKLSPSPLSKNVGDSTQVSSSKFFNEIFGGK